MADIALLDSTSHFVLTEFDDFAQLSPQLLIQLFQFRDTINRPIRILHDYATSGHHHKKSFHYSGMALDIAIYEDGQRLTAVDQWILAEKHTQFHGIGVYPNERFIHVDIRPKIMVGRWIRTPGGTYVALDRRGIKLYC